MGGGTAFCQEYGLGVDPKSLIEAFGTIGLFAIVFAESGLLAGFFLPGDSLLFTAGLLASEGHLNFPIIVTGCFVAAVAGDQVGYVIGRRYGPAVFKRPELPLLPPEERRPGPGLLRRTRARRRSSWPASSP